MQSRGKVHHGIVHSPLGRKRAKKEERKGNEGEVKEGRKEGRREGGREE